MTTGGGATLAISGANFFFASGGVPASQPACAITRSSIACDSVLLPSSASASPAFCWTHAHADVFSHARASCSAASRSSSRWASSSFRRCTSGRTCCGGVRLFTRLRAAVRSCCSIALRAASTVSATDIGRSSTWGFLSTAATGGAAGVTGSAPPCAYPLDFASFASIAPDALCCSEGAGSSSVLSCCMYATPPATSTNAQTPAITVLRRVQPSESGTTSGSGPSSNPSSALVAARTGREAGTGALSDGLGTATADSAAGSPAGLNRLSRSPRRSGARSFLRSSPNAAARSAPQFGQLSAFLRNVLPQRWQTTENMDAGKVRRVVILKPSKDMCVFPCRHACGTSRAMREFASSNPSFSPCRECANIGKRQVEYVSTRKGRQSPFAPRQAKDRFKGLHHCASGGPCRVRDPRRTGC